MFLSIDNRKEFINKFLHPLGKLSESLVIKVSKDRIYSIGSSSDGTLILYSSFDQKNDTSDTLHLNIPDVNRLTKVLGCITDDSVQVDISGNNISYKSDNIGFKYHLLEDGIITTPAVSIEKIKKLKFDLSFDIDYINIIALLKGSTFATETDKLYFYTKEGSVYGQLTDMDRHNVDVYTQKITDKFTGTSIPTAIPLNFETVRIICGLRFDKLRVSVNTDMKVFIFDIEQENTNLSFISSAYIS